MSTLPTLVVVSGPPGSGKTTLAHEIARALGCPAICRDEIKEGMVHPHPGLTPSESEELSIRTLGTFFSTLELLLRAGVTTVAEAAFQDRLWRPGLTPLLPLAQLRVVHCTVAPEVAHVRIIKRASENAHRHAAHNDQKFITALESGTQQLASFDPVRLPVPELHVDTSGDYSPALPEIVAFLNS